MNISATQLRVGMVIIYKDDLYRVTATHHLTPGNKRGHVQAKMKRLKDDVSFENRFRSEDIIERANLEQREMQYLYSQDDQYHFMDNKNFEQIVLTQEMMGEAVKFLLPETLVKIEMHEGNAIGINLPQTVDLKVVSTEAVVKRATAQASYKPAELETGLSITVPPFIKEGDVVRVDTENVKYLERVNK